ncbi:MAG TPA: hypothetical protein VFT70_18535 [Nocardioides sp.]|nr:hypothetical protein [Nocardioides sp.]
MTHAGDDLRHVAGSAVGSAVGSAFGWGRAAVGALDAAVVEQLDRLPAPLAAASHQARALLTALTRMPLPTAEVQALVEQLHAQRRSIQAMEAQLAALDHQLKLLEDSLRPVEVWVGQVQELRDALTRSEQDRSDPPGPRR